MLVADELIRQTPRIREAIADGACLLAVCGGYQLLGHRYRGHQGDDIPGTGLVDLETVAGDTRLIGNVLVDCGWRPDAWSASRTTPGARGSAAACSRSAG